MNKKEYCINCEHHQIINDRDPDDWFNDDDVAITCQLKKNRKIDLDSKWISDRSQFKVISASLRPYEVKKVETPIWCPLIK